MRLRIKVWGNNIDNVNYVINEILKIVDQLGIEKSGPIPLPTRILRVPTMRTLGKRGTKIWETYQMRIYRRIIEVAMDERFIKQFMRIQIPSGIQISMKIIK
ncbi:MAG TPA: 30S ribosomal protein S10 [Candidatus Nanopusillus sp.]|nr:30S ribosomal protein S10 [Candidatus Nanopusillus sp.]